MKAIVADLIWGSFLSCLLVNVPARASSPLPEPQFSDRPVFLSAKVLQNNILPITPLDVNFEGNNFNLLLSIEDSKYFNNVINLDNWLFSDNSVTSNSADVKQLNLAIGKKPFSYHNADNDLILGFHPTFWPSNTGKYWGLTSVEQWGEQSTNQPVKLHLNKSNLYPFLPEGTSTLTVSGGGSENLIQKDKLTGEFTDFRGGIAFHRGLSEDVTLGMGFVYDELLLGFSQISFQPNHIPLKTTFSLLSKDEKLELHSHVRFQPADNFVFNFHSQDTEQKFDLNWGIISGLTLTAKGNSEKKYLNAGLKLAFKSEYFSLAASAKLDNSDNLHWDIKSKLGDFQLTHTNKPLKTKSELSYAFLSSQDIGFQCSLFFNYETRQRKRSEEYLNVWGWRFNSGQKLDNNKYRWTFDLGYGFGSQGSGIIASTSTSIKPNVFLKLSYQEISVTSNEPKLKLEIGSNLKKNSQRSNSN